ncbi:Sir2 family NAD-dependent protein deacetylase [Paenibacillus sp. BAC0078]
MKHIDQQSVRRAKSAVDQAEYIVIGGGAGLSAAAGIEYSGERFTSNFKPFIEKYGLTDMYSSGFYPFKTQEERWAYWARHISLNRYEATSTKLYTDLLQWVQNHNYFVITTNVDSQFEKAGFPQNKIFEIQGNYGFLQCAAACHDILYNNEALVKEMLEQTANCRIPSELVPKCPVCGGEMNPHLRINQYFVQNGKWYDRNDSYNEFLRVADGKKTVYLELGVGYNTPGIIRYPFEKLTYRNEHATLIRLNKHNPEGMEGNEDKTISFTEDMQEVISALLN